MISSLLMFGVFITIVNGYSRGSPSRTCLVSFPYHESPTPQSNDNLPYTITISPEEYTENSTLNIIIKSHKVFTFKGILMTIKPKTEDIINPVGTFLQCNSSDIRFYNFSNGLKNCLTQRSNIRKPAILHCTYLTPPVNFGPLILSAVLVKDYKVFWMDVNKEIKYNGTKKREPLQNPTGSLLSNYIATIDSCGTLKNCILYPRLCEQSKNCKYMVSYSAKDEFVNFELVGPNGGYIALGISNDTTMTDDMVVVCSTSVKSENPILQTGYTRYYKKKRFTTTVDHNVIDRKSGKQLFGDNFFSIVCKFRILKIQVNPVSNAIPTDLTKPLHLFLATGDTIFGTSFVKKHKVAPLILSSRIVLYSSKNDVVLYFQGLAYYKRIHGTLMTIAFIVFQSIAIMVARHFRQNLSMKIAGRALWFDIHLICNFVFFILAFIGYFYMILCNGFTLKNAKAHGSIGTIVMILTAINIISGFTRPDLTNAKRWIFSWSHFIIGVNIRVCGLITFWLVFCTINLMRNYIIWMFAVVIIWTVGELAFGMTFWVMRLTQYQNSPRNDSNALGDRGAHKYHIGLSGLFIYIGFLLIMAISMLYGIWTN